jgi:hypothetical protein
MEVTRALGFGLGALGFGLWALGYAIRDGIRDPGSPDP